MLDKRRRLCAAFVSYQLGVSSPELAASIGRVNGAKRLGVRLGNWLTTEQNRALLTLPILRI